MTAADQLSLFADRADRPAGLEYWSDFISADEERKLIETIPSTRSRARST
jgi:hypothetical protein